MTLNIISDIHCGYDYKLKKVCWNRRTCYKTDEKTNKEIAIPDSELINTYTERAIDITKQFKDDVIKNTDKFANFDYSKLNTNKAYYYRNKYKCKSFNQCIEYLDKIINYLKTKNYLRSHNMFDMCRSVEYFCNQIITPKITLDSPERCFLRRECDFVPERLKPADYLIVAGDLGLDGSYKEVYKDLKKRTKHLFKDVFFIKGNHDYWCFKDDPEFKDDINLDDRFFEKRIDNYLLLGCTMWAPIQLGTWQERCVARGMNDYNYIPGLTTKRVNQLYQGESNWLRSKCQANPDKKIIIFTHHNPISELIDDDYAHSEVNAAYAVLDHSCDDIKPLVWICGHSHSYKDITKNGIRYLRNPIGYRESYNYLPSETDPKHWYNTVIEV